GQINKDEGRDSKGAATELAVKQEIELPDLINAAVRWIQDRASGNIVTSSRAHATATDFSGRAVTTGAYGHAVTTGCDGRTVALGNGSHAIATNDASHAAALGDRGHAA